MVAKKQLDGPSAAESGAKRNRILLVGDGGDWQSHAEALLVREGYDPDHADTFDAALDILRAGDVRAILVGAGPLGASDILTLRRIREIAPRIAVLVVTQTPTDPDLKRAFEHGATAFLSWPASSEALLQAIDRGGARPSGTAPRGSQ